MQTIIEQIIPIFAIMTIGYLAGRFRLLPAETGEILCSFLFYFCLPSMVFANIVQSNIREIFDWRFAVCFLLSIALMATLSFLLYEKIMRMPKQKMVLMSMGSYYSNLGYLGIPLFASLFSSVGPIPLALLLQAIFVFPVILFLLDLNTTKKVRFSVRQFLMIPLKNPIILCSVIGSLILVLNLQLPDTVIRIFDQLGKPASTAGLFALGFTCNYGGQAHFNWSDLKVSLLAVFGKLLLHPALAWLIARYILHMQGRQLDGIVITCMLPTAMNHFIISQRYHSDIEISRSIILLTTLGFAITISFYIVCRGI